MLKTTIEVLKQTELSGQQFTVYGTPQEPLFLAQDVAQMIEHPNTSELIKLVGDDEKLTSTILRSGQRRQMWMLTEYGLYEVLMQSRKPVAKLFKKWVKELLKSIRTKGMPNGRAHVLEDTSFRGVPMVATANNQGYYFRDVLKAAGYSPDSGSSSGYKKRYPNEFFKLAGRNYCTPRLAEIIEKRADLRQLEAEMAQALPFGEEGGNL